MLELVRAFVDICLFRRGPQDLPASRFLLYSTLGTYVASGFVLHVGRYPATTAALVSLTDAALLVVLTVSLLYLTGLASRVQQTLAALAGAGTVLAILTLVPNYWFSAQGKPTTLTLASLLVLVLVVWNLVVMGHIIRHALSTRWFVGLIVAVMFYWIVTRVILALFPLDM